MAWIEAHQKLKDDPKMLLVADAMGWDDDQCIGKLFRFWWWCVDHAPNGDLRQFNDGIIARQVGLNPEQGRRFIDAMTTKVGGQSFIERDPYFRVSNWWKFIGRFLKIKYKDVPEKWKAVQDAYTGEELPDVVTTGVTDPVTDPATRTTNLTNLTNQPNTPQPPEGEVSGSRSRKKKKFEHDSVAYQAAKFFAEEYLKAWAPSAIVNENDLQNWAQAADGMFRLDHRLPDDFNDLLDWLNDQKPSGPSGFLWRNNIRSLDTLRKRWKEGKFSGWLAPSLRKDEFR